MAEKLSNVIGAPFDRYILEQLYTRAARNSTSQRSNEEVLFLANKSAWARLISSVDITAGSNPNSKPLTKFYEELGLGSTYTNPQDLARNWILEAGTSIKSGQGITLRSGIGAEGAYGLGGIAELGYRPMPGLSSVQVETVGRLGSLKQATINFKVWNMNQLNVVEALYFRLGYSMLLEWGHTQYFNNSTLTPPNGTFTNAANTFGLDDPFVGTDKTTVQQRIAKKARESSGNYDGMLGIVSNFTWSFNQEGGYDCTVKLIGLGSIIDSVRINQSYKMPPSLEEPFKEALQTVEDNQARKAAIAERDRLAAERSGQGLPSTPPSTPTNASQIYTNIYTADQGGDTGLLNETSFLQASSYPTSYQSDKTSLNSIFDYYYKAEKGGSNGSQVFIRELNTKHTGLFLSPIPGVRSNWQVVFAQDSPPVSLSSKLLNSAAKLYATEENLALTSNLGTDDFVKVYDETIKGSKRNTVAGVVNNILNLNVDPDEPVPPVFSTGANILGNTGFSRFLQGLNLIDPLTSGVALTLSYVARVQTPQGTQEEKTFYIIFNYKPPTEASGPTRKEVIDAIQQWFTNSRTLNITSIEAVSALDFGKVDYGLNPQLREQERPTIIVQGTVSGIKIGEITPNISVTFNNTAFIENVLPSLIATQPAAQAPQTANTGDTEAAENKVEDTQTNAASKYESALHVMLSYIKTAALAEASLAENATRKVIKIDLLQATKAFYQDGIFKNVFDPIPSANTFNSTTAFNVTYYAQKGFNSNLMANALSNPSLYGLITEVDFNKLCTAYLTQYQLSNQATTSIESPVYITFGYLLAFLNNMCLIYASKQQEGSSNTPQGNSKTPYVYIDFNPETNFCLSSPQHLSIDPTVCLIPFQGGKNNVDTDFKSIFPSDVISSIPGIFLPQQEDELSGQIPEFKTQAGNTYQGKTMNILLNVDFLLKIVNSYVSSDPEHSVNLQSFLDTILVEVNKSLGNLNLFRVAYRDDSNTVQIKDDQWVPGLSGEETVLNKNTPTGPGGLRLGELPIFGQQSLARAFQFKTETSTKMGSMIAISAQAATGSINAIDASSLSYLNANYQDRFKPYVVEGSGQPNSGNTETKVTDTKKDEQVNNDLAIGEQFNIMVKSIYSNFNLDIDKIEASKNYYIERVSKIKSTNQVTSAAPFIPANLELTIDGISGILMGNAFTIPESRLPLSLRGTEARPKVGFIVVGLAHTIQENQWLTKIRGQMIKLREDIYATDSVAEVSKRQTPLTRVSSTSTGCTTDYPELTVFNSVQVETLPIAKAASYLKTKYPDVGKAAFAIIVAEASKAGDNFRSAGGNNFGGVQTDSGKWAFSNFNGQFCRRDSGGVLRMFASFNSPEAFLDFLANRVRNKGFANTTADQWTRLYIDQWWNPSNKQSFVPGTAEYDQKLSIFKSAAKRYDLA